MNDPVIGILGAGPAGLALALALCRAGYRCALIDAMSRTRLRDTARDTRTTAVSLTTKTLFDHIGIGRDLSRHAVVMEAMCVATATGAMLRFDPSSFSDQPMGYIVQNRHLRDALLKGLDACIKAGTARLDCGTGPVSISTQGKAATLVLEDGSARTFDLLVACDGRTSKARKLTRMRGFERDYGQTALVAVVRLDRPHGGVAFQVFTKKGPIALLPLAPDAAVPNRASLIWSVDTQTARLLLALPDGAFDFVLNRNLPDAFPAIEKSVSRGSFPLHAHYLSQLVKPNFALLGEAAHGIHPLAGQGFNLSAKDIGTLVESIGQNVGLGFRPGDLTGLRSYQTRRTGDTALMFTFTDLLARGLSGTLRVPGPLQHLGFQAVERNEALKRRLTQHAMGLSDGLPLVMRP